MGFKALGFGVAIQIYVGARKEHARVTTRVLYSRGLNSLRQDSKGETLVVISIPGSRGNDGSWIQDSLVLIGVFISGS